MFMKYQAVSHLHQNHDPLLELRWSVICMFLGNYYSVSSKIHRVLTEDVLDRLKFE